MDLNFSSLFNCVLIMNYLDLQVGFCLYDRIIDIKRDLNLVLDLGCGRGHVLKHLHSVSSFSILLSFK